MDPHPASPLPVESLRTIDRLAESVLGLPTIVLMEHAAIGLARLAETTAAEHDRDTFLVVCGSGNNGGDGFAAARLLAARGHTVTIVRASAGDPKTDDARTNAHAAARSGVPSADDAITTLTAADTARTLIIDALLGTGLTRAPREPAAGVIHAINAARERGAIVVAADIPSGLDADTGQTPGVAVRAHATATFAAPKLGFDNAQAHTGRVVVVSLGFDAARLLRTPPPPGEPAV